MTPFRILGQMGGNNLDTGMVRMVVHAQPGMPEALTPAQLAEVQSQWERHAQALRVSLVGFRVHNATLQDGSRMRIVSNSGQHTIEVWPVATRIEVGSTPLWILVNVGYLEGHNGNWGGAGLTLYQDQEVHSYLYRLPPSLSPASAVLEYQGETTTRMDQTPTGWGANVVGTVSDVSGAIGALSSFAPENGRAALYAERQHATFYRDTISGDLYQVDEVERTCKVHAGGVTSTYTLSAEYEATGAAVARDAISGDMVYGAGAAVLAPGQANYSIRSLSGTLSSHTSGTGGSTFNYLSGETEDHRMVDIASGAEASDPDGTSLIFPLTASVTPYTRREVGFQSQSKRRIFYTQLIGTGQARVMDRGFNEVLQVTAIAKPIFFTDDLVIHPTASPLVAGIYTHAGALVQQIDLMSLPSLAADSLITSGGAAIDTAAVLSDIQRIQASVVVRLNTPRGMRNEDRIINWTDASASAAAGYVYVNAMFVTDQGALW